MRLVLDTNVVTSAMLWRGMPYQLLQAIRQRSNLQLYSGAALLEELANVLARPSLRNQLAVIGKQADELLLDYISVVEIVKVAPLAQAVCRNPDDDDLLALALAAQADLIVSGSQDLIRLRQFETIPIVTARQIEADLLFGTLNDCDLPDEVDFSGGRRSQFYRPESKLNLPAEPEEKMSPTPATFDDPAFGMWRDRTDMADVAGYIRRIRAPRFNADGSRNES